MAKYVSDIVLDGALNITSACESMTVCSGQPTTWAEATATFCLATQVMSAADYAIADDTSGRKLTMASKTGLTIDSTGVADHIALTLAAGSTLRLVTTCTSQSLTSGGTVDVPSWKESIADPT